MENDKGKMSGTVRGRKSSRTVPLFSAIA